MLGAGGEAMTKENPALVAAREHAANALVIPAKQLPREALQDDQRFKYAGTIRVERTGSAPEVWLVTDEDGRTLAATSDEPLRVGSCYRVRGTNGELHLGPDWIHVEHAELIANYGTEPKETARLTKGQRRVYQLIRREGTLTLDDAATLLYLESCVSERAWKSLRIEERKPRRQAAWKHIQRLLLLGLIESKVIDHRVYYFVPQVPTDRG